MAYGHIRPSTISGIKQLAKRVCREDSIPLHVAQDKAARVGGFQNYTHARRTLGVAALTATPKHVTYISILWRDRNTKAIGQEVLPVALDKPLDELLRPWHYKMASGLASMRREAADHLTDMETASSQERARSLACYAARVLQFVQATGLRPSNARRSYPQGRFQNQMPRSDHSSSWYDPMAKVYVRVNEPYSDGEITEAHKAWMAHHGWDIALSPWKGMYSPDGGCCMFLSADKAKGYKLKPLLARLTAAPPPVVAAKWNGESRPNLPRFVSPGQEAEKAAKAAAPLKARAPNTRLSSIEYIDVLSGKRRRPKWRMPIAAHREVGGLLKSTLVDTWRRKGVYERVNSVRHELDNWVQREYSRTELSI